MSARTVTLYEPGYVIAGKYELEQVLGEGGMGAVWCARNIGLDASVAIKVVRSTGDASALRSRLLQEARAAAKLSHPAIVKVFDVGQTESGDPFIVMELLSGHSLGTILAAEGRLSSIQAVRTLLPIVDALWLAHGKGIVHRDLKPDNVFIVQDEATIQPKLVDFGIVKVQVAEGESQLTQDGVVLGSPDYMSPEQARGEDDVDHLTDVWALCVVLYEAISGSPPFKGSNYNALLRQIVEATPITLRELSLADDELSAIVSRGLSKERRLRYGSMGELGRALATWLASHGVHEDICGSTIDAKWLRGTDPHGRAGRASMVSIGDTWLAESGSGVRPNALRPINTLPAPPPMSATDMGEGRPVGAPRPRWLLPAGAGVVLTLFLAAWLLFRSGPEIPAAGPPQPGQPSASGLQATDSASGPAEAAPAPIPVTELPAEPSTRTVPAQKPALSSSGKVSSSTVRGPARGAPKASSPDPSSPAPGAKKSSGGGDLISPY
jgi:eukaryotic-like serine/threonine-protein kinase